VWLWRFSEELRRAVEDHGWDGGWYLRAYDDDGRPLGSARNGECRIEAISQAWAVLAGLDPARCRLAMDAAWAQLVDEEAGLIRLLTPPFEGRGVDPGYIRAYPAGIRENGGQYTHGALWLLLALIRQGDARHAHEALRMLLPVNHADSPEKAAVYRVEPSVMPADVYDRPGMEGRGGWTWYTGSAAWMTVCLMALLGYERRGARARLNALLGDWESASLTIPCGKSRYRLTCQKGAVRLTLDGAEIAGDWIELVDDGTYTVSFPGIFATKLADSHTIVAGDCTITVSPMSYVHEKLASETAGKDLKDLLCALYAYAEVCGQYNQ
jgi:cellobiose phosphorylase